MEDTPTIIDGDILETTFEKLGTEFDRFVYVSLFTPDFIFVKIVPFMYARNITGVFQQLKIMEAGRFPILKEYSVNGELLYMLTANAELIIRLVQGQMDTIPLIYQELRDYRELGPVSHDTTKQLEDRLITFFKRIKVGNVNGESIYWLPENYGDDPDMDEVENGDFEDYIRRVICGHVKNRRLPMAHLLHVPSEHIPMVQEFIRELPRVSCFIQQSHFAPLFRDHPHLTSNGLKTLMCEEFRCVKNDEKISGDAPFVFTDEHLTGNRKTVSPGEARTNLRYYIGDYFDELDLSQSFITGSAISASIIKSGWAHGEFTRELLIELLYPKLITKLNTEDETRIRNDNINLWNTMAISESEGVMVKGPDNIHFTIKPGSDVDIAIDNTVSDEEYRAIVQRHFDTIKRCYSYVKIREYAKPKGDWNYVIYTDNPDYIPVFRTVEIYRSSFRNICSHHVGAVRGCFTSRWSEKPQFYLTASAVWTSLHTSTPNYHYFAGRKSNPQDVILKNMCRGILVADEALSQIMHLYKEHNHIKSARFPFYEGRNVSYSIFAAPLEYPLVRDKIERENRKHRGGALIRPSAQQRRRMEQDQRDQREYLALRERREQQIRERQQHEQQRQDIERTIYQQLNLPVVVTSPRVSEVPIRERAPEMSSEMRTRLDDRFGPITNNLQDTHNVVEITRIQRARNEAEQSARREMNQHNFTPAQREEYDDAIVNFIRDAGNEAAHLERQAIEHEKLLPPISPPRIPSPIHSPIYSPISPPRIPSPIHSPIPSSIPQSKFDTIQTERIRRAKVQAEQTAMRTLEGRMTPEQMDGYDDGVMDFVREAGYEAEALEEEAIEREIQEARLREQHPGIPPHVFIERTFSDDPAIPTNLTQMTIPEIPVGIVPQL